MILTTITPCWGRPEQLRAWSESVYRAAHPDVHHILVLGDDSLVTSAVQLPSSCQVVYEPRRNNESIGYYHNLGAQIAETEWIMKLDVDALPNEEYFIALLDLLRQAGPRQWFNGGMFFVSKTSTDLLLPPDGLSMDRYWNIMRARHSHAANSYLLPAASNFICRRADYLRLGGCLPAFKGYGWEDYQQIYMLEKYYMQLDPLPGPISLLNVTQRCRDEIGRPKARQLWQMDSRLCLIHRWHKGTSDPIYRSHQNRNRAILFDYIIKARHGL